MNNIVETDASVVRFNYKMTMIAIYNNLRRSDLNKLKFLCSDFIPLSRLEQVNTGCNFVQALEQMCLISAPENVHFLAELLWLIGRIDLLQKLNTSKDIVQSSLSDNHFKHVSAYRYGV